MTPTPLTENPADLAKMRSHYPSWDLTKSLVDIFSEVVQAWKAR
jgi:CDP-paratose 2-epimerase